MGKEYIVKPAYELIIAGKNVTDDVSPFVSSVSYTDRIEEESDDVNIVVDDIAGFWQSKWYPAQGDSLSLLMGYEGQEMLDCGDFEIDEIELSGPPDTMTIKAIAAAINKDMRTRTSKAYEKQTLKKIAQSIADKHGLTITGDTARLGEIEVGRMTQDNISDLAFLSRVARRYGIIFSVRGTDLVFQNPEDLEKTDAIASFKRTDLSKFSFKDKTSDTYEAAEVSRRDIKTNKVVGWRFESDGDPTKKDTLMAPGRVENDSQAEATAKGALRERNKDKLTGSITIVGNPLVVAGVNVDLQEFGAFSAKWTVKESTHTIDRDGGYTTTASLRKGPYKRTMQAPAQNNTTEAKNWAGIVGLS